MHDAEARRPLPLLDEGPAAGDGRPGADTGVWFAIERPTPTAMYVVVDHTLAGLAAKLDAEDTSS